MIRAALLAGIVTCLLTTGSFAAPPAGKPTTATAARKMPFRHVKGHRPNRHFVTGAGPRVYKTFKELPKKSK